MPTELEAKLAVSTHEAVRDRLRQLSAQLIGRVMETNSIHDVPDGRLRRTGCGLRVRDVHPLEQAAGFTPAVQSRLGGFEEQSLAGEPWAPTLTFKGPVEPGVFKKREELEIRLSHAQAMRRLLEAVGFVEVLRFQKRRESWRLNACRVELDELPHLGSFVEIEGPGETEIRSAQEALGLASAAHIARSYVGMFEDLPRTQTAGQTTFDFPTLG